MRYHYYCYEPEAWSGFPLIRNIVSNSQRTGPMLLGTNKEGDGLNHAYPPRRIPFPRPRSGIINVGHAYAGGTYLGREGRVDDSNQAPEHSEIRASKVGRWSCQTVPTLLAVTKVPMSNTLGFAERSAGH